MIRGAVGYLDERLGGASFVKKTLRYVFPDHWTFMLGEIALYAFVVLVGTGIYLTLFFEPDLSHATYHGRYGPLQGVEMTKAYLSTLDLSFGVKAGLLMRQTHHWAANVFVAAIVVHLLRVLYTGAFRKPRDVNLYVGATLLALAVFEGYAGYSLPDDLLSGAGLAIGYAVLMSVPIVGAWLAVLVWAGEFPGGAVFESRLYIVHVLVIPLVMALLISIHLFVIVRQKHTQFPDPGATEHNVVGVPLWPGYALRSLGLFFAVAGTLFLLGGLVQINPIWLYGPYHVYDATNGAQPDWYVGWLIGALRLMPQLELHVGGYTIVPNAFFGGVLFPLIVFGLLYLWPTIERRVSRDDRRHEVLFRPRDRPWHTATISAFFAWVGIVFFAGSADQLSIYLHVSYVGQLWFWRIASLLVPPLVFLVVRRVCRDLRDADVHPLRGAQSHVVERTPAGGFAESNELRRDPVR